jgi:hypothetical protein
MAFKDGQQLEFIYGPAPFDPNPPQGGGGGGKGGKKGADALNEARAAQGKSPEKPKDGDGKGKAKPKGKGQPRGGGGASEEGHAPTELQAEFERIERELAKERDRKRRGY